MPHLPPVVVLTGPTASGKSALSLLLAERLPVEVVTLDSAQVYRGMDIGTAKPSAEEQLRVPHHLLDLCDPSEAYSAARYAGDATAVIADIRQRQRIPLVVGGTLLYLRALLQGLSCLPSANAEVRAALAAEAAREGVMAMHARLAAVDPDSAARLHPNDWQRIQRALEIHRLTGEPASRAYLRRSVQGLEGPVLQYVLMGGDRASLHARIAARFAQMMDDGLLAEVEALYARGDLHDGMPSIRCVGYRQLWQYLDGRTSLPSAVAAGVAATRQLAKRQLTWLRREADAIDLGEDLTAARDRVCAEVERLASAGAWRQS